MVTLDDITYERFGIDPATFYNSRFVDSEAYNVAALPSVYKRTIGFQKFDLLAAEAEAAAAAQPGPLRVLDLGCGSGRFGAYVKARVPGCHLTGVDLDAAGLEQSRINGYDILRSCDFTRGLPFPDGAFDFVYSFDVFGHIEFRHKDRVVGEVARVTRPGGRGFHGIEAGYIDYLGARPDDPDDVIRRYVHIDGHIGVEPLDALYDRFARVLTVTQAYSWLMRPVLETKNALTHRQWGDGLSRDLLPLLSVDAELVADAIIAHFNSVQLQALIASFGPILTRRRLQDLTPPGPMQDYLLALTSWGGFAMLATTCE